MSRSFTGQVAIITGASSGLGWAMAKVLAAEGCEVGLVARRRDLLDQLAGEIGAAGGTAVTAEADVADRAQTVAAIHALRDQLGPVDLLIANAGMGKATRLDPFNAADAETVFRVNFFGVLYAVEAVLPEMLQRGQGHLSAVSSMAGYKGMPGESGYCSSKAAVNTFLEGLRIQLRGRGIAVTTLCPGFVRTPMTKKNRFKMPWLLEADDAARRMVNALRRRRKVYNFPWQMALLMRLTRWVPDWLLARTVQNYNPDWPATVPMP